MIFLEEKQDRNDVLRRENLSEMIDSLKGVTAGCPGYSDAEKNVFFTEFQANHWASGIWPFRLF